MQTATLPVIETHHAPADVRILVAADDMPARLTLEAVLHKSGYSVDSAASSAEAMETTRAINLVERAQAFGPSGRFSIISARRAVGNSNGQVCYRFTPWE